MEQGLRAALRQERLRNRAEGIMVCCVMVPLFSTIVEVELKFSCIFCRIL